MKKILLILLALCTLALGTVLAQESIKGKTTLGTWWSLGIYNTDISQLQTDMDLYIERGFTPLGLEVNPGTGLTVLYVRNVSGIKLKARVDQAPSSAIGANLGALLKAGWLPQEACVRGDITYILSLEDKGTLGITGSLDKVPATTTSIKSKIEALVRTGLVPVGFSYGNNELQILSLKDPRNPVQQVEVSLYQNNGTDLFKGTDSMVLNGWRPVSLTTSPQGIYVLYVK